MVISERWQQSFYPLSAFLLWVEDKSCLPAFEEWNWQQIGVGLWDHFCCFKQEKQDCIYKAGLHSLVLPPLFICRGNFIRFFFVFFYKGLTWPGANFYPPMTSFVGGLEASERPSACHMVRPPSRVVMAGNPVLCSAPASHLSGVWNPRGSSGVGWGVVGGGPGDAMPRDRGRGNSPLHEKRAFVTHHNPGISR